MDMHPDGPDAPQSATPRPRRAVRRAAKDQCLQEGSAELRPHLLANRLWEFAVLAHELRQPLTAIHSNAQAAGNVLALDTPDL